MIYKHGHQFKIKGYSERFATEEEARAFLKPVEEEACEDCECDPCECDDDPTPLEKLRQNVWKSADET